MLNRKSVLASGWKSGLCSLLMAMGLLTVPLGGFSQTAGEEQANDGKEQVLTVADDSGEMPKPLNMMKVVNAIGYPDSAKDAGLQGRVTVRILVGKEGEVADYKVVRSPGKVLTRAVEAHIEELVFRPGTLAGEPVEVWVMLPISFAFDLEKHGEDTPASKADSRRKRRRKRSR